MRDFIIEPLRLGRKLELRFWSMTIERWPTAPAYKKIEAGIQYVINTDLNDTRDSREKYTPESPNWGKSGELFSVVKSFLPPFFHRNLMLYNPLGTSLDWYQGVDAFFSCKGVYVTIDITLREEKDVNADFPLYEEDIDEGFLDLGEKIALKIQERWALQRHLRSK